MGPGSEHQHPAVVAALSTVGLAQPLRVRGVAIREPAAVVLLGDDRTRRAIILSLVSGTWTLPTMMAGGDNWDPADRPTNTRAPWALTQPTISQSGPPTADGSPPAEAWTALCGVAARDAASVQVRSTLDEHEVTVPSDGVVLAVLRAPWGGRLEITVRTPSGDVRHIAP